jgi:hypothetical protein
MVMMMMKKMAIQSLHVHGNIHENVSSCLQFSCSHHNKMAQKHVTSEPEFESLFPLFLTDSQPSDAPTPHITQGSSAYSNLLWVRNTGPGVDNNRDATTCDKTLRQCFRQTVSHGYHSPVRWASFGKINQAKFDISIVQKGIDPPPPTHTKVNRNPVFQRYAIRIHGHDLPRMCSLRALRENKHTDDIVFKLPPITHFWGKRSALAKMTGRIHKWQGGRTQNKEKQRMFGCMGQEGEKDCF